MTMPAKDNPHVGFSGESATDVPAAVAASVNLWLMQWRYKRGHLSLAGRDAAIKAHPEWRRK